MESQNLKPLGKFDVLVSLIFLSLGICFVRWMVPVMEKNQEVIKHNRAIEPYNVELFLLKMASQSVQDCGENDGCYKSWVQDQLPKYAKTAGYNDQDMPEIRRKLRLKASGQEIPDELQPMLKQVMKEKRPENNYALQPK